jgi:acyl-CoA thioester hydrolase
MAAIGQVELVVSEKVIDINGHVNNVQYVQWMQEAAMAHSSELGWPRERYADLGRTWIVRSHTIEYYHSAYAGETIRILTWVADIQKIRSLRKFKFVRPADQVVLAFATTLFIFCDLKTGRPVTIPQEVRSAYTVLDPATEP